MTEQQSLVGTPVYIPWQSLESYIAGLKGTSVPHTLDNSVKPSKMAGGLWRQLTSALQFLGLIDAEKRATGRLEELVEAHGSESWPQAVESFVLTAYEPIIGDLPIENATQAQLNKRFKEAGVDGQMLQKSVRFYLHALRVAGVKFSAHFNARSDSPNSQNRTRRASKQKPNAATANGKRHDEPRSKEDRDHAPTGFVDIPIPLGDKSGFIRVPLNIQLDGFALVQSAVGLVEAMANRNSKGG